ncbi:MAG: hypothetical protein KF861_14550, partial [Planctomycetaceae bacterium]|nr:hypothetical protein [Planctomycetaceae bacterium]
HFVRVRKSGWSAVAVSVAFGEFGGVADGDDADSSDWPLPDGEGAGVGRLHAGPISRSIPTTRARP